MSDQDRAEQRAQAEARIAELTSQLPELEAAIVPLTEAFDRAQAEMDVATQARGKAHLAATHADGGTSIMAHLGQQLQGGAAEEAQKRADTKRQEAAQAVRVADAAWLQVEGDLQHAIRNRHAAVRRYQDVRTEIAMLRGQVASMDHYEGLLRARAKDPTTSLVASAVAKIKAAVGA